MKDERQKTNVKHTKSDTLQGEEGARVRVSTHAVRPRVMTEVEAQEWRDLKRRVRMYEDTFKVRYTRD